MISVLDFQAGYHGFESRSGQDNFQTISTPNSYSTCLGLSIKLTGWRLMTDSSTKCAWVIHGSKAVQIHVHNNHRCLYVPRCLVALKICTITTAHSADDKLMIGVGVAKVLGILCHWGVQLILASSWARPAIFVAGKGRGGIFLFLLFLHFHSCSSFFLTFSFISFTIFSISFSLSLGDNTKWPAKVELTCRLTPTQSIKLMIASLELSCGKNFSR